MRQLRLYSVYSENPDPEALRPAHYYLAATDLHAATEMTKQIKSGRVLTVREESEVVIP